MIGTLFGAVIATGAFLISAKVLIANNAANNTNSAKNNNILPNITTNSHYGGINEDNQIINSESSKKVINILINQ